jgi:hypothetical protein
LRLARGIALRIMKRLVRGVLKRLGRWIAQRIAPLWSRPRLGFCGFIG